MRLSVCYPPTATHPPRTNCGSRRERQLNVCAQPQISDSHRSAPGPLKCVCGFRLQYDFAERKHVLVLETLHCVPTAPAVLNWTTSIFPPFLGGAKSGVLVELTISFSFPDIRVNYFIQNTSSHFKKEKLPNRKSENKANDQAWPFSITHQLADSHCGFVWQRPLEKETKCFQKQIYRRSQGFRLHLYNVKNKPAIIFSLNVQNTIAETFTSSLLIQSRKEPFPDIITDVNPWKSTRSSATLFLKHFNKSLTVNSATST